MYLAAQRRRPVERHPGPVLHRARDPRFSRAERLMARICCIALYDGVLDEPVPERLTALLKR